MDKEKYSFHMALYNMYYNKPDRDYDFSELSNPHTIEEVIDIINSILKYGDWLDCSLLDMYLQGDLGVRFCIKRKGADNDNLADWIVNITLKTEEQKKEYWEGLEELNQTFKPEPVNARGGIGKVDEVSWEGLLKKSRK